MHLYSHLLNAGSVLKMVFYHCSNKRGIMLLMLMFMLNVYTLISIVVTMKWLIQYLIIKTSIFLSLFSSGKFLQQAVDTLRIGNRQYLLSSQHDQIRKWGKKLLLQLRNRSIIFSSIIWLPYLFNFISSYFLNNAIKNLIRKSNC